MTIDEKTKPDEEIYNEETYKMPERTPDYNIKDDNGEWLYYMINGEKHTYKRDDGNPDEEYNTWNW